MYLCKWLKAKRHNRQPARTVCSGSPNATRSPIDSRDAAVRTPAPAIRGNPHTFAAMPHHAVHDRRMSAVLAGRLGHGAFSECRSEGDHLQGATARLIEKGQAMPPVQSERPSCGSGCPPLSASGPTPIAVRGIPTGAQCGRAGQRYDAAACRNGRHGLSRTPGLSCNC